MRGILPPCTGGYTEAMPGFPEELEQITAAVASGDLGRTGEGLTEGGAEPSPP
jgi:hypothetical protein